MTESEILQLNRELVEYEIGAQEAYRKKDRDLWLRLAWKARQLREELKLHVGD